LTYQHRTHNLHAFDKGKQALVNCLLPFEARFARFMTEL
jgi:hypothetical protein